MAEHVSRGFIGGHFPTQGWYSAISGAREKLLSIFEAATGLTPLVRIRFDLDGDGVFETVEDDKLNGVGSISWKMGYDFGLMAPATMSVEICNNDGRWSDALPSSLTHSIRYIGKRAVLEINFDWINKGDEDYWIAIYSGYIQSKSEDPNERVVKIGFTDEWSKSLKIELTQTVNADAWLSYVVATDTRPVTLGIYYGKKMMFQQIEEINPHLYIPCVVNMEGAATIDPFSGAPQSWPRYRVWKPLARNISSIKYNWDTPITHYVGAKICWFWLWNDLEAADGGWTGWTDDKYRKQQWAYTKNCQTDEDGQVLAAGADPAAPANGHRFYNLDGVAILDITDNDDYFDSSGYAIPAWQKFNPQVVITPNIKDYESATHTLCTDYWLNPVHILYHTLVDTCGFDASLFDRDGTGFTWPGVFKKRGSDEYFTWDYAERWCVYFSLLNFNVHISEKIMLDGFINELCRLTGGYFYTGFGVKSGVDTITRTVMFSMLSYYFASTGYEYLTIDDKRGHKPEIGKSNNCYTTVKARYHKMFEDYAIDDPNNTHTSISTDAAAAAAYGERVLDLATGPGDIMFYYEQPSGVLAIANKFKDWLAEPFPELSIQTDMQGMLFDIGVPLGAYLPNDLYLDPDDVHKSGFFEVREITFNTNSFLFTLKGINAARFITPPI